MSNLDTEDKIIKAATKLFAEKGFEGVRTKEIAKCAGISEVTLFKYFPRKEILYMKVSDPKFKITRLDIIIKENKDNCIKDILKKVVIAIVNDFYDNKDIIKMNIKATKKIMKNMKKLKSEYFEDPIYELLLPVFIENSKNGVIKDSPELACKILIKSVKGICMELIFEEASKKEILKTINSFINIYFDGILIKKER